MHFTYAAARLWPVACDFCGTPGSGPFPVRGVPSGREMMSTYYGCVCDPHTAQGRGSVPSEQYQQSVSRVEHAEHIPSPGLEALPAVSFWRDSDQRLRSSCLTNCACHPRRGRDLKRNRSPSQHSVCATSPLAIHCACSATMWVTLGVNTYNYCTTDVALQSPSRLPMVLAASRTTCIWRLVLPAACIMSFSHHCGSAR